MSREFGLDWKKYDSRRMQAMIAILGFEAERDKENGGKMNGTTR